MHYHPKDLKNVPVKNAPVGSMGVLVGREDDIPLILRLADEDNHARIMMLGGSYSFHAAPWNADDEPSMHVLCKPEELRFKLNDPNPNADYHGAGMLTLFTGGACITALRGESRNMRINISTATWTDLDAKGIQSTPLLFPEWELGRVNCRGEFKSLFKRDGSKS